MYENVPAGEIETVLRYLRHQVRELEAELARRGRQTPPAPPAQAAPAPGRTRWAVERNRYNPHGTVTLHTLDCAMSIGADTVSEQEAHAMVRDGRGAMDCDCARGA